MARQEKAENVMNAPIHVGINPETGKISRQEAETAA